MDVLIIDDDKNKTSKIIEHLKGDNISLANNYIEGIKKINSNDYDLLILDMNFPIREDDKVANLGEEVLEYLNIRKIYLPTIVYSGDTFNNSEYYNVIGSVVYGYSFISDEVIQKMKDKAILYNFLMSDNITNEIENSMDSLLNIIPEIKDMIGFPHNNPNHHLDVWEHTLLALSLSNKDYIVRLSLLLHDIGKPHSYQDKEVRHFNNHPSVSCKMSKEILDRLYIDNHIKERVLYLVLNHDTKITKEEIQKNYSLAIQHYEIQRCDALAHNPNMLESRVEYLDSIQKILKP